MKNTEAKGKAKSALAADLDGKTVAVLGGGISGMTAALKLSRAGFKVTLYEMHERLGGNTSSRAVNGIEHDVYPHMFCSWYDNFWNLYENDLELSRDDNFDARTGSKILQKGESEYGQLLNPTSIEAVVENLKSGVMTPAEMWLLGYSNLELAAHPFNRSSSNLMEMLSVNGFIYSRGYGTEDVAAMQNYLLTLIWSIPSAWTAAGTYQNFLRHTFQFPNHAPFNFLLRNSLEAGLNKRFTECLEDAGCDIRLKTEVTALRIGEDDRPQVFVRNSKDEHLEHDSKRAEKNNNRRSSKTFDFAVMALPVQTLCDVVLGKPRGIKGERIVDRVPDLSGMQNLSSVSIPVIDIYLKKKVEDLPSDHIALAGSKYGMTVLDISQLWKQGDFGDNTALVVAASQATAIPSVELERQGELMLQELAEYFPWFNPGKHWGDAASDVDWNKTWIRSNLHYQLFLNDTGSWGSRPQTLYADELPRIVFAGDCVKTGVDMATVEGAVQGGVQAAAALQVQHAHLEKGPMLGDPIKLIPHTVYSTAAFRGARLAFLPATYLAFAIAAFDQWKQRLKEGDKPLSENEFTMAEYLMLVPTQYTIDWWKAAYWFARSLVKSDNKDPFKTNILFLPRGAASTRAAPKAVFDVNIEEPMENDRVIGLGQALFDVAREVLDYASGKEKEPDDTGKREPLDRAIDLATNALELAFDIGESIAEGLAQRRRHHDGVYRRRWRAKP